MNIEELKKLQEERKKQLLLRRQLAAVLEPKALERLDNVKLSNPKLWQAAVQVILTYYSKVGVKLSEEKLIAILKKLKGPERESKIEIRRK
jgi:DNA-binding TFAR19-related protein (PDSD5 family)